MSEFSEALGRLQSLQALTTLPPREKIEQSLDQICKDALCVVRAALRDYSVDDEEEPTCKNLQKMGFRIGQEVGDGTICDCGRLLIYQEEYTRYWLVFKHQQEGEQAEWYLRRYAEAEGHLLEQIALPVPFETMGAIRLFLRSQGYNPELRNEITTTTPTPGEQA